MGRAKIAIALVVALMCVAGGALVAGGAGRSNAPSTAQPRGPAVSIDAKYARAAAVVQQGTLTARKGIKNVTHPGTGQYCLRLKNNALDPQLLVPQVTVEWGLSSGYDIMANWYRGAADCPAHNIEIQTFDESGGWVFSDDVSFSVVIP